VKAPLCVLFFAATSTLACFGQTPTNSALPITRVSTATTPGTWSSPGRNEFSMWGGFSPNSPTFIGASEQRTLSTMGLRYARLLTTTRLANLKYTFDVIPVALIRQPVSHGAWEDRQHRETRYGAGLSPIGLQLNFRSRSRIQPFAEGNGGFLYFTRPTPYTTTSNFNFTFSLGAGFQTFTSSHRAVTFGYKYHHLSNAYLAPVNPGMDSNVFYVGYSLFR
jgi:opacity protein-like surface antigen